MSNENFAEQTLQETNVHVQNARRLLQLASRSVNRSGPDLSSMTAVQAAGKLGVTSERIELVLEPKEEDDFDFFTDGRRGGSRKPHYDIASIHAVKTNTGCEEFDPVILEIAADRLRLLEMTSEPTKEMVRATQTAYISNIFREPCHFILQVRRRETAEDILRRSAVRMIAWTDDESLTQGFRWWAILSYGSLETARAAEKALQLFVDVMPCPEGKDIKTYRHELMDGLMLNREAPRTVFEDIRIFADYVVEENRCPEFAKALATRYDESEELQNWAEPLLAKWKGHESELTALMRRDHRWICPIVQSLSVREQVAFHAFFGDLKDIEGIMKAGPKPSAMNIPQLCPCDESVWRQFITRKAELVQAGGRWAKPIPVDLTGRMLALRMQLVYKRPSMGYAYRSNGSFIKGQELLDLTHRARRLAVDALTGEVIDLDGNPVDAAKYFPDVAGGDVGPVPAHILEKQEKRMERREKKRQARALREEKKAARKASALKKA